MKNQKGQNPVSFCCKFVAFSPHYADVIHVVVQIACRKKKRGRGKGESSDKSDSDDVEVIKEWNTSSRGGNPEGRNRAEPVEEGKFGSIDRVLNLMALY